LPNETKKSEKANLENRRSTFFKIGLILSMSFVWMALEWKTEETTYQISYNQNMNFEDEVIPITERKPEKPKPEPKVRFEIVKNDKKIKDEFKVKDIEIDPSTVIEPVPFEPEEFEEPDLPLFFAEVMPVFGNGDADLLKYLSNCIKFTRFALDSEIQGTVFVTFVVGKTGKVRDVKVLRGLGYGLDKVAVECIANMPKWKPGSQKGVLRSVRYNVPIKFVRR